MVFLYPLMRTKPSRQVIWFREASLRYARAAIQILQQNVQHSVLVRLRFSGRMRRESSTLLKSQSGEVAGSGSSTVTSIAAPAIIWS